MTTNHVFACTALLLTAALTSAAQDARPPGPIVFVNATVTGDKNDFVRGLKRDNFQVFEDGKEQKVEYFSAEDNPWTFGIIVAVKGLLPGRADQTSQNVRDALNIFRENGNPGNRYMVDEMPFGADGIFHNLTVGLQKLSQEPNPRKALLVLVDGFDTTDGDPGHPLIEFAKKLSIPVYLTFIRNNASTGANLALAEVAKGDQYWLANGRIFEELTNTTGGRMNTADALYELGALWKKTALELRNQYVVGFVSANDTKRDTWRKLSVKVNPPKEVSKVKVQAKGRYFAPNFVSTATPALKK